MPIIFSYERKLKFVNVHLTGFDITPKLVCLKSMNEYQENLFSVYLVNPILQDVRQYNESLSA